MNVTAKTLKVTQLDDQIRSGNSLTVGALAHHLNVDRKRASIIAKASGLAPECGKYSWLRIWRAIHGTEGAKFTIHLAKLQRLHPGSAILGEVKDLEAALRAPLIDFDAMASRLGLVTNTLSRALREGRHTLPFPMIILGQRARHFRPLEVTLWVTEGIRLDLPKTPAWASAKSPTPMPRDETPAFNTKEVKAPVDTVKKDIFGHFAGDSRSSAA